MKKDMKWWLLICCLSTGLVAGSCDNEDHEGNSGMEATKPLKLELKLGAILKTSAAVQTSPVEGEGKYIVHLFTETDYEAAKGHLVEELNSLAEEGKAKTLEGVETAIYRQLSASTDYVACALPVGAKKEEEVKQTPFTTASANRERIPLKLVFMNDYGDNDMKGVNNFRLNLSEADYVDYMWVTGKVIALYGTRTLVKDTLPENPAFFDGLYAVADTVAPGTLYTNNSSLQEWKDREMQGSSKYPESGEFALDFTKDQCSIIGWIKVEDKEYEIDYEGPMTYALHGFYGYQGYTPQLEEDKVDLTYTLMKDAAYCATKDGVSLYTFSCVHDPDPTIPSGGTNKNCLRLNLYAPTPRYPMLEFPTGTYVIAEDNKPFQEFTGMPGDYVRISLFDNELTGNHYYYLDATTLEQMEGFIREGTITVSREGDDYLFEVNGTTNRGCRITGRYHGPITLSSQGL